ncbi:hypothetical protein [Neisseria meningitidis]|uniref:hypothetical protein n=1 Tax=Neisseria meningitidis TaxID=487 RepID=UPI001180A1F2|nr:hypothetical protein [Neisseria meningitidis]
MDTTLKHKAEALLGEPLLDEPVRPESWECCGSDCGDASRRRAADSTNSTEPIHLVLQHLRESFSLSQGEPTLYRFKFNSL